MKKCSFCAEEIQNAAIKCRYCGERLDARIPPQKSLSEKPAKELSSGDLERKLLANGIMIKNPNLGIILMCIGLCVFFANCTEDSTMAVLGFIIGFVGFALKLVGKARHDYYRK